MYGIFQGGFLYLFVASTAAHYCHVAPLLFFRYNGVPFIEVLYLGVQSQLEAKSSELAASTLSAAVIEERLSYAQTSLSTAQADTARLVRVCLD